MSFGQRVYRIVTLKRFRERPPVVPVLRLYGTIGPSAGGFRPQLNLFGLAALIEKAFSYSGASAVALAINSPGGSPVQSALIAKRIRDLAAEKNVKVFAFTEDVAASGGYWLACAADEIYAESNSIIGSIGVISAGFGFHEFIGRYGVERRVHATSERKGMLDPFRPERQDDVDRLRAIQDAMFDRFKAHVRERRGERLAADESEIFNGDFWTGQQAVDLGLVDGLGDIRGVMRDRYGEEVRLRPIVARSGWLRSRVGSRRFTPDDWLDESDGDSAVSAIGDRLVDRAIAQAHDRALWSRFGL